ncbi:MAG: glycosyl hydrolase family 65 protein [Burkholderiales bacterium]|nr:glycosyl hydrolase family 65 protein [Burkholderiales bacterium]
MSGWTLDYEGFDPSQEGLREALCTLGNGYFATRGAAPEARADGVHYPGTYLAGGYNRLRTDIAGRSVENEDLVNLPNWLALGYRIGGEWFALREVELLEYRQSLDLRRGLLGRVLRWRDRAGRVTGLVERRLVHMGASHYAAIEVALTAENWSGELALRSSLDGRVENAGVERYRDLDGRHLEPLAADALEGDAVFLAMRTRQSRLEIAQAARTRLYRGSERLGPAPRVEREDACVSQDFAIGIEQGETVRLEKVVALYTSRDRAISECGFAARKAIERAPGFAALEASQALAWEQLWRRFDIDVRERDARSSERTQRILRLHLFHLLQTASPSTIDLDVGVPARGWHGEAYRGHIFWDELFIFPLLNLRLPEITRALILYRYRRLAEARANARAAGYRGAMYPWQSGSSGREESQQLHLNPRSGRWIPDNTHLQRHVNAAIAYNVWLYYQVTRDMEFLAFYGAEMLLEIARFWASFATYNAELDRYEILGVVGPDEFHTAYPDADRQGLDNHSYTNIMAVWVLCRAPEALALLPEERRRELREQLDLRDAELAHWEEVASKMRVVFHGDGIISQFEGYEALAEIDWDAYRGKYGDIHRLDRILEAEGDSVNRYKVAKQADVLMLFYLFSSEELGELFERLGYGFEYETIPRNVAYYGARTSHGSTLSRVVDSWVLARSDRPGSWRLFKQALESDVADIQGGTTPEGIHLGAMAGVVDLLQRGYTGMVTRGEALWLNPDLPQEIECLEMVIRYRGHALDLRITQDAIEVHARPSNATPIKLGVLQRCYEIAAGQRRRFRLDDAEQS